MESLTITNKMWPFFILHSASSINCHSLEEARKKEGDGPSIQKEKEMQAPQVCNRRQENKLFPFLLFATFPKFIRRV